MANYSLKSCESLITRYVDEYGGYATTIRDGILGLGTMVLHGAIGKKSIIINEYFINSWASGHTIRKYNKLPKKYEKLIEDVEHSEGE